MVFLTSLIRKVSISFLQPDRRTHTLTKLERYDFDGEDVIDLVGQGSLYVHIKVRNDVCSIMCWWSVIPLSTDTEMKSKMM